MKKVVLAYLLACVAIASGLPAAYAQTAAPAAGADGKVTMSDAEYASYNNAMTQTTPQAKSAALEAYLTQYPQSAVKQDVLVTLMAAYSAYDATKTLDAADRVLQLDPNNLQALTYEAFLRKSNSDSVTDATAKQAALDGAAGYAQKGLAAPKPAAMSDADFKTLQSKTFPIFYSVIGAAALNKKDGNTAVDAFKKELSAVPTAATQTPGPQLQDTYYLGLAYMQSTPPDYLDCAFYVARFVAFAPEPYKTQIAPTAKYCYKKYHGGDDGYDAVVAAASANLNPPDGFQASIKPAPTAAEIIDGVLKTTPDLATLAPDDREFILQSGTPEQAAKVWDAIKGKSVALDGAVVVASTPTQLQVSISSDAKANKTADFTFNLKAPDPIPDLPEKATPAQKLAYKKKQEAAAKDAAALAAATAVGQTVTVSGTYDSYTPNPIMITMSDGEVVLPKAETKPAAKPAAHPAHKPAH
jgi:hypothetical protein